MNCLFNFCPQSSPRSIFSSKHVNMAFLFIYFFFFIQPVIILLDSLSCLKPDLWILYMYMRIKKVDLGKHESITARFLRITPLSCFSWKKPFSPEGTQGQGNKRIKRGALVYRKTGFTLLTPGLKTQCSQIFFFKPNVYVIIIHITVTEAIFKKFVQLSGCF